MLCTRNELARIPVLQARISPPSPSSPRHLPDRSLLPDDASCLQRLLPRTNSTISCDLMRSQHTSNLLPCRMRHAIGVPSHALSIRRTRPQLQPTSIQDRLNYSWCHGSDSQEPFISFVTGHLTRGAHGATVNKGRQVFSSGVRPLNSGRHAGDEDQRAFWPGINKKVQGIRVCKLMQ